MQQHEFNLKLNEIKLIPYQYKQLLNKDKSSARPLLNVKNTLFFCILCGRADFTSSTWGIAILGLIIFYVVICYE